jgi:hypothetical protein
MTPGSRVPLLGRLWLSPILVQKSNKAAATSADAFRAAAGTPEARDLKNAPAPLPRGGTGRPSKIRSGDLMSGVNSVAGPVK